MHQNTKTMTRRELYDLVWSKPMQKLAEEFGMSDRGLAKLCERHRVPVPPRGYWAKIHAGHKVKQAIFREVKDAALNRVVISATVSNLPEETRLILRKAKEERAERAKSERRKERIVEPVYFDPVEKPHSLVRATAKTLRRARADEWGAVHATGDGECGVTIHKDSAERAISILDRLVRAIEEKGWAISAGGKYTRIALGQDSLRCKLSERTRRVEHEPTEAELAAYNRKKRDREKRYAAMGWGSPTISLGGRDWDQTWPDYDTVYTGQLAFVIDEYGGGLRKSWADGKTQTVEKLFDQILVGIEAYLAYEKSRREEREEWKRKSEEMQCRRALARQRKEREDKRIGFLKEIMEMQQEAAELRAWLSQTHLAGEETGAGDLDRMIAWSRQRLAELEAATTPDIVSAKLSDNGLFPEVDELHDPLGDPPDGYYW